MTVAIIDYGSGNLRSAAKAFERVIRDSGRKDVVKVTASAEEAAAADRIVLPGVGAFADCRHGLERLDGMVDALEDAIIVRGKPFLGICVGMQLMATRGLEHGEHEGFGWIEGEVTAIDAERRFRGNEPADGNESVNGSGPALKIPHMGWNDVVLDQADHPVFAGLQNGSHAYFVHSYQMICSRQENLLAHVDYGGSITAAVGRDNLVGTQFHPEKSQTVGLKLIGNFLSWQP